MQTCCFVPSRPLLGWVLPAQATHAVCLQQTLVMVCRGLLSVITQPRRTPVAYAYHMRINCINAGGLLQEIANYAPSLPALANKCMCHHLLADRQQQ